MDVSSILTIRYHIKGHKHCSKRAVCNKQHPDHKTDTNTSDSDILSSVWLNANGRHTDKVTKKPVNCLTFI